MSSANRDSCISSFLIHTLEIIIITAQVLHPSAWGDKPGGDCDKWEPSAGQKGPLLSGYVYLDI